MQYEAKTLEEWKEQVKLFIMDIREWKVPVTVGASSTPWELEEGDNRTPGCAHLMAHGYARYGSDNKACSHSASVRSTCPIPDEEKWICRQIREDLLNDGYAVGTQPDTEMTHLFHRGRHPDADAGIGWLSFGVRMDDGEAIAMLLRDFGGVRLLRLDGGIYLGMNEHYD